MSNFICPVCGSRLNSDEKTLFCDNRHSFDVAKSGYVNLLLSQQQKEKRHGDDKLMVISRRDFLDKGYYIPLLEGIRNAVLIRASKDCIILDAGCGECWYTSNIYDCLQGNNIKPVILGVDISKDALIEGAKRVRGKNIELAVASTFRMPVETCSCDIALSCFAPFSSGEFNRVLKKGGVVIRVVPLEKHLLGLKKAVYKNAYENEAENLEMDGFILLDKSEVIGNIHLDREEDIFNLFTMTPYYYKTGPEDQEKLRRLTELDTEIEFGILTYGKK